MPNESFLFNKVYVSLIFVIDTSLTNCIYRLLQTIFQKTAVALLDSLVLFLTFEIKTIKSPTPITAFII